MKQSKKCNAMALGFSFLMLGFGAEALAQMRCSTELITEGDTVLKLLEFCGEPSLRQVDPFGDNTWIYNFGPTEFVKIVTIREGRIDDIEDGGYGFVTDE